MYQIFLNNEMICDSRISELSLINPVINMAVNTAGTMSYTIEPTHPFYNTEIKNRKDLIKVVRDENEIVFEGVCVSSTTDFYKQKTYNFEGVLTFLNDSVQRPYAYKQYTVRQLLEAYVEKHNAITEDFKHFTVGMVTVTDSNDSITCFTNYNSTMKEIEEDLLNDLGGYLRIRYENGVRYLDYIAESTNTCTQIIELGENLINFKSNIDTTQLATVIIPQGATLEESSIEGLQERLSIKSVNSGKDYVESEAVSTLGRIEQVVVWDSVTVASNLKAKAIKYLTETQFDAVVIEANAIDLHLENADVEPFKLLDKIRVKSSRHGLDKYFLLTQLTMNLNAPQNDVIVLGQKQAGISSKVVNANEEVLKKVENFKPDSILDTAMKNAKELIEHAQSGYISTVLDENGNTKELLITDTNSIETALKVWRWNVNGLAYASRSNLNQQFEYRIAMTMNGDINADFVKTGNMSADRIQGGVLTLGGVNNQNGVLEVYSVEGNKTAEMNNKNLYMRSQDYVEPQYPSNVTFYGTTYGSYQRGEINLVTSEKIELVFKGNPSNVEINYICNATSKTKEFTVLNNKLNISVSEIDSSSLVITSISCDTGGIVVMNIKTGANTELFTRYFSPKDITGSEFNINSNQLVIGNSVIDRGFHYNGIEVGTSRLIYYSDNSIDKSKYVSIYFEKSFYNRIKTLDIYVNEGGFLAFIGTVHCDNMNSLTVFLYGKGNTQIYSAFAIVSYDYISINNQSNVSCKYVVYANF